MPPLTDYFFLVNNKVPVRQDGGFINYSLIPESSVIGCSFLVLGVNFSSNVAPLYIVVLERAREQLIRSKLFEKELCLWDRYVKGWSRRCEIISSDLSLKVH